MASHGLRLLQWVRWVGLAALYLGFALAVLVLLFWLAGKFSPKVSEVVELPAASQPGLPSGRIARATLVTRPLTESAVGTIRSAQETTIASKLLARVVAVEVKAGQIVRSGDVLIRLDEPDLQAKLQQAKAALASAEATRAQAVADAARMEQLVKSHAVSRQEDERAKTAVTSATAEVLRAQEAIKESQAMLDWATLHAPMDGIIIDKKVDVGDTVVPGQALVTLFNPKRMQLIASVRESLAHRLEVGQDIDVQVDVLNKRCRGKVSEVVPESQAASRAFLVKVTGPCPTGIYTGMFGRILIPLDEEQVLEIPKSAVQHVGQLEMVDVMERGRTSRRAVRTGRAFDDNVEVLSGLREGEDVVVPQGSTEASHE